MSNHSEDTKRIAKNTLLLYVRMLFGMLVSLYTSRVVLQTLGVEDYGICNVVGGVVSMLAFFNSSMATSTQRFLNYEMGKGNQQKLKEVFSNSINAHVVIGIFVVLALETVGLWFVYNKLNIPSHQFDAAIWVYHCSVLSFFLSIISTPYGAAIVANERMGVYAYFSILEIVLKLLIVYLLVVLPYNKLIVYSSLQLCVAVIMRVVNNVYCVKNFKECSYSFVFNKELIVKMFTFSGWMLFGCISDLLSKQGVNILINIFFGPVFNASRAIALQVQGAVGAFSSNFMFAVRPQIVKSYSSGNFDYMYKLVFSSSKMSFYLMLVCIAPVFICTEYIMNLWLGMIPEYCVLFTRFVLFELLVASAYEPIAQINQASGKIKNYQLTISVLFLLIFIATYIVYKLGFPVYYSFVISLLFAIVGLFARILVLKKVNSFPAVTYLYKVILPLLPVIVLTIFPPMLVSYLLPDNFVSLVLIAGLSLICAILSIWLIGLNKAEKQFVTDKINNLLTKIRR